jgi:hypothetical protein
MRFGGAGRRGRAGGPTADAGGGDGLACTIGPVVSNPWIDGKRLRNLAESGYTLDEIASVNERETGWKPDRSVVSRKLRSMGIERRVGSRKDLIPWRVRTEHYKSRWYYALLAESRRRAGEELAPSQQRDLAALDHAASLGMVVGYDREIGWFLADRREGADTDVIRAPGSGAPEAAHADDEVPDGTPGGGDGQVAGSLRLRPPVPGEVIRVVPVGQGQPVGGLIGLLGGAVRAGIAVGVVLDA